MNSLILDNELDTAAACLPYFPPEQATGRGRWSQIP
jgi:hypothetical protein